LVSLFSANASFQIDFRVLGNFTAVSLLFLNALSQIISTPSGICTFSIILSAKAESLICFNQEGNFTEVITLSLNTDSQISVILFHLISSGIVTSLSKHLYSVITNPPNHACESAVTKQESLVAA
jgi:hypothetical protein